MSQGRCAETCTALGVFSYDFVFLAEVGVGTRRLTETGTWITTDEEVTSP